jgi:N-acetylmuramoyl-L-alanine amidase
MKGLRSAVPLLLALLLGGLAVLFWLPGPPPRATERSARPAPLAELPPEPTPEPPPPPPGEPAPAMLSDLAPAPDWSSLNRWQSTSTLGAFRDQLESVFTVSGAWREWFHFGEGDVRIDTEVPGEYFRIRFAARAPSAPPREWRAASDLGPAPPGQPLDGLRIAIDPGHIGGRWARIEERWFQIDEGFPVAEGDMTLLVALLLRPQLEALGAEVVMVRDNTEPVTDYRPEDLVADPSGGSVETPKQLAERLFYRTAEIRARARKVNRSIRPDLVVCLHFNAEPWGDPRQPTLVDRHHFHLIVNGAYMDGELALADQRFELTHRIVSGIHHEEVRLAESMAATFVENTGLPPYLYRTDSKRAVNVAGNPYVWARNLLANRLYHCPVVFLEPYVMNSVEDYARIQAGDYEGLREVYGELRPSIFREYADSVAAGLSRYYTQARPQAAPGDGEQ